MILNDQEQALFNNMINVYKQHHAQRAPGDDAGMMAIMSFRNKVLGPKQEETESEKEPEKEGQDQE